jgi:ubiquinone/menaquinone biosynthesis C-methylase UbiE
MTLESTGERFLPWMDDDLIYYEHFHRYIFATYLVKGKTVLDLACGEGYGGHMLAKIANSVIGIDINKNIIEHASTKYQTDNLAFIQGSILQIPLNEKIKFDVIVCFEAIEHIENHDKLLSEVNRILKNDGIFIVSSPDRKLFSDNNNYVNPYHKKELYFEEFDELLKKHFRHYKIFGQNVYGTSNIWEISPSIHPVVKEIIIKKRKGDFVFSESKNKKSRFFIGIASNIALDEKLANSILTDISDSLNEIKTLETQLTNLKRHTGNLENIVIDRERKIRDFENIVIDRERKIRDFENIVIDRDNRINNLESKIAKFEEISKSLYRLIRLWMRSKIN